MTRLTLKAWHITLCWVAPMLHSWQLLSAAGRDYLLSELAWAQIAGLTPGPLPYDWCVMEAHLLLCHCDNQGCALAGHVQCLVGLANPSAAAVCIHLMTSLRITRCFPVMYLHSMSDVGKQQSEQRCYINIYMHLFSPMYIFYKKVIKVYIYISIYKSEMLVKKLPNDGCGYGFKGYCNYKLWQQLFRSDNKM